jgi:Tfp pilus assembly protein PilO
MDYTLLTLVLFVLTIALAIDNVFKRSKIKQLKAVNSKQATDLIKMQSQIVATKEQLQELEKKPKSKEILEILNEINSTGTLLSISRVDQDNVYFHQNGR